MMRILGNIPHPYKIIGGGFNIVLNLSKKKGGLHSLDRD